jgi:diguanylate cyclase (GGDEF)-like protein/PAS domain S-box-containing protein
MNVEVPMDQFSPVIPSDAAFYREILDQMSDGVYFVDRNRRILFWSEGASRLTGYSSEEVLGRRCQDEILRHVDYSGKRLCHDGCPLSACIRDGEAREMRIFLHHKSGHRLPVLVRAQPLRANDGSIVGAIEIFSDDSVQTEALRRTEELKRMALLDHLTQLPNRRFLELSLQYAINLFHTTGTPFGVLILDIDRFKEINDRFGHAGGDRALQEIAKSLLASFRPTDVVGRWGGDEFAAVIMNATRDLLEELSRRCALMLAGTAIAMHENAAVTPAVSVGFALAQAGDTGEELFRRADQMMYQRKQNPPHPPAESGGSPLITLDLPK